MENSLQQLNTAIQARIQKENLFIQRITQEFARISADLQRTASANPQVQLQPFIRRIDEATELLNRRPSFGTNFNLDALVQSVKGRPPIDPDLIPNPTNITREELEGIDSGVDVVDGGRRRSKYTRSKRSKRRSKRSLK